ncbi:hypothetical protein AVEN_141462-1 [Araneus ventricosus]|uniref:Uncharacterized protein n=1 Tax=Araneus ventricosus TaxID=182803 RepID=A0A4Y2HYN5_ARAVE|nr:hypothetical protein AVEN_141462-1 [Araneus ventricosus]
MSDYRIHRVRMLVHRRERSSFRFSSGRELLYLDATIFFDIPLPGQSILPPRPDVTSCLFWNPKGSEFAASLPCTHRCISNRSGSDSAPRPPLRHGDALPNT